MAATQILRVVARLCAGALLSAEAAAGHDYWLELSTYRPRPGERVAVLQRVGERLEGETLPRNSQRIGRFESVAPGGVPAPIPGRDGFDPAGVLVIDSAGAWRAVYQGRPSYIELDAAKFGAHLELEGIAGIGELRKKLGEAKKPAREAFSRSAIGVACAQGPSPPRVWEPVGLELEIVPESDLCSAKPGDEIGFRLLKSGQPAAGVLMKALDGASASDPLEVRTDATGRFRFRLPRGGVWLVKGVAMERAAGDARAEWRSAWASLTFELSEGATSRR
jgi:hypothetical protein